MSGCFPCSVAKRDVELRLAAAGAPAEEIVARKAATLCLMCGEAERQERVARRRASAGESAG